MPGLLSSADGLPPARPPACASAVSVPVALIGAVVFFLPWLEISCKRLDVSIRVTGYELASGAWRTKLERQDRRLEMARVVTRAPPTYLGTGGFSLPGAAQTVTPNRMRGTEASSTRSTVDKTTLERNIDSLRSECGWTFEELAEKVALEKSPVLAHVHEGARPRPGALKKYADVFTKALGRTVAIADLDG